jgi:hypothetical protein
LAYHQPFQITGFHSCDREVGLRILNGDDNLHPSDNIWDWLGPGAYFWEENPGRALEYAEEVARGTQKNRKSIETPLVIGAIIELGNCLNLLEPKSINILRNAHASLRALNAVSGDAMPVNNGSNRRLDCAVIKFVHESNRRESLTPYDTIRCAFLEGKEIYPGSHFTDRLHIEICVINTDRIKGYFFYLLRLMSLILI